MNLKLWREAEVFDVFTETKLWGGRPTNKLQLFVIVGPLIELKAYGCVHVPCYLLG